jgi:NAD-dependent SIR2 family protein deacetylase
MQEQLDRVRAGDPDPACTECGGIHKSATVAFGQQLDPALLQLAFAASSACDLFLAIGTSLTVQPAALLAAQAKREGARLVIVNQGETSLDDQADARLRGPIGEVLPRLAPRDYEIRLEPTQELRSLTLPRVLPIGSSSLVAGRCRNRVRFDVPAATVESP